MVDGGDQAAAFAARNHALDPYQPGEGRAARYLASIHPAMVVGDDPIGTLIASHARLVFERQVTAGAIERRIDVAVEALGSRERDDTCARGEPRVSRRDERLPVGRPHP